MIFDTVKIGQWFRAAQHYPIVQKLVTPLIPKDLVRRRMENRALSRAKALKRMETKTDRADFMTRMADPDAPCSLEEFVETASTLIIAGSETTATLLSGATYFLCMNPDKMKKLTDEIRGAFKTEADINLININTLEYTLACLEESLRMYAPVPGNFPRNVPHGGDMINGGFVPENVSFLDTISRTGRWKANEVSLTSQTVVSVSQFATYRSTSNFNLPNEFHPERWLGDKRFDRDNKAALQPFHLGPRNCLGKKYVQTQKPSIIDRMTDSWRCSASHISR